MTLSYNGKVYLSGPNSGVFTVTKLSVLIISGTFKATLYNKDNPSETVQITDGRIDINAQTLNK